MLNYFLTFNKETKQINTYIIINNSMEILFYIISFAVWVHIVQLINTVGYFGCI